MENFSDIQKKDLLKCISNLRHIAIISHLKRFIPNKQEFINQANSMNNLIRGDGSGLGGGILVDLWIIDYFTEYLNDFQEYHVRESDYKILDIPYSFKKISGGSDIALSWSKNPDGACERNYWEVDIMILNLKSGKWWVKGPKNPLKDIDYTRIIPAGLYIIDKDWAKNNIVISTKSNKTNAKIDKHYVYEALITSMENKTFLELPDHMNVRTPSFVDLFN